MKKPILILLLIAALAVAWYFLEPADPSVDIASVDNTDIRQIIAERNAQNDLDDESEPSQDGEELDDTGDQQDAIVNEPVNVAADVQDSDTDRIPLPEGDSYTISDSSVLLWEGKRVGGMHNGDVTISEGVVIVSNDEVIGGEFLVDMTTIKARDIDDETLDNDLKNWFNTDEHPTAMFVILEAAPSRVEGIMTINGVSKLIAFPATVIVSDDMVMASAAFALDKNDFNLGMLAPGVSQYMELSFDLSFRQ